MGKHTWLIPAENRDLLFRLTFTGASISCFAATFSKISFGVTLLRLTKGKVYAFVWFSIIGLFIVMLPSAMLTWIQCKPTAKLWISSIGGTCWPPVVTVAYGYFNTAFCVIVDFALALIPWMVLRHLKLHTREKIGLGIAMSMGFLAGICAVVKGLYLKDLTGNDFFCKSTSSLYLGHRLTDSTVKGKDLTIWTSVETATAIVGASIPVLRVYLKNSIETLHDRYHRTDYEGNTVTVSAPSRSVAIPLSIINLKSAKRLSVHSITETTGLRGGTPPENDIIVQTNTVTIEYFPQRQ
jgi:hypothetical protein